MADSSSRQWRFDADDQLTMLIPSYWAFTVRDGRIDRFEFFPDDDQALEQPDLDSGGVYRRFRR